MAWHYDPPTPQTEADAAWSDYRQRRRADEARNRLDVDADDAPSTPRSRNPVAGLVDRIKRMWRRSPNR